MNKITAKKEVQFGKEIITLQFAYDKATLDYVKSIKEAKYSGSLRCWYIPYTAENAKQFGMGNVLDIDEVYRNRVKGMNAKNMGLYLDALKHKGTILNTKKTYIHEFCQFLSQNSERDVSTFTLEDIRNYLLKCIEYYKNSEVTLFSRINSIKFFYEKILGKTDFLKYLPNPQRSPRVQPLTVNEIESIIEQGEEGRNKLMIVFVLKYSIAPVAIVKIKVRDLDLSEGQLMLPHRVITFSNETMVELQAYLEDAKPKEYLFENGKESELSLRMLQVVINTAVKKAGIKRVIGKYTTRISYGLQLHQMRIA